MENPVNGSQQASGAANSGHNKQLFIKDLRPQSIVRTSFLVRSKELMTARNGKPYLCLSLGDRTGSIDTRVWENADHLSALFDEGDVVAVAGKTHQFQNRLQLVVEHLAPIPPGEADVRDFVPQATEDLDRVFSELLAVFQGLSNPWIRDLGLKLLNDPDIARRYKICPAAKTIHHAFLGGLLVHSMQLIKLVDAILPLYQGVDRDRLIFGAAFHDFGKIYELSYDGDFGYTDEGKLVGHITIACGLIDRKIREIEGFPQALGWELKHLVLSHHGRLEYGSPKRPATLEAQILHHLDDMDSKINSIQTLMQSEHNGARWTQYHRAYDQYYYKPDSLLSEE